MKNLLVALIALTSLNALAYDCSVSVNENRLLQFEKVGRTTDLIDALGKRGYKIKDNEIAQGILTFDDFTKTSQTFNTLDEWKMSAAIKVDGSNLKTEGLVSASMPLKILRLRIKMENIHEMVIVNPEDEAQIRRLRKQTRKSYFHSVAVEKIDKFLQAIDKLKPCFLLH